MSSISAATTPSLDVWLDGRIKKLRQEAEGWRSQADANDKLADLLAGELEAYRLTIPGAASRPAPSVDAPSDQRKAGRQITPGSKTDQIIKLVRDSGPRGMRIGDIQAGAVALGLGGKPDSIRGLVWAQKQAGRFVAVDDRYYAPENAPANRSLLPQTTEPSGDSPEGGHQTAQ